MLRSTLTIVLALATCLLLWAQRERPVLHPPYEMKSVFPQEIAPGEFRQVDQRQLELFAEQGWELVSVTPFVYRNEERGDSTKIRPVVTQTYLAYFLKRPKLLPK